VSRPDGVDPIGRDPRAGIGRGTPVPAAAIVRAGGRDPVVVVLVLAGFFDAISGNPIHGLVLGAAAVALAFDEAAGRADGPSWPGLADRPGSPTIPADGTEPAGSILAFSRPPSGLVRLFLAAAALAYAVVVGGFARYSWPVTVAIVLVGLVAVVIAWRGPLVRDVDLPDPRGAVAWAVVFVTLGLWELAALLMQPSLTTDSWEHPTLSTLMDSVLGSHPARTISLLVWLLVGGFLIWR
jgi:hypothetical protein